VPDHPAADDTAAALAAFGLRADGALPQPPAARPYHLWPCNWPVWCVWVDVQTQWRVGMAGPTGLDYAGVQAVLQQRLPLRQRKTAFWLLQGMEEAALQEYARRRPGT